MENEWPSAIVTAFLLAPPSILGLRALLRGPTRFAGMVVPEAMDRLAATVWLAALPLTIVIVFTRIHYFPPRSMDEANRLANDWGPLVLRVTSVFCLITGGIIAWQAAKPEEKPRRKGMPGHRKRKR